MTARVRWFAIGALGLAVLLFAGWRAWWVPNDLVLAHRLQSTTSLQVVFRPYDSPATPQPVATLAAPDAVAPLLQALDRPLQFREAMPGCGDWFDITFVRQDGTSYTLGYYHGAEAGTLVYRKGEHPGSARAPREFYQALAPVIEPFLATRQQGCD